MFRGCREKITVLGLMLVAFLCGAVFSSPTMDFLSNLGSPNPRALSSIPAQEQTGAPAKQTVERQFGKTFPATATNFYYASQGDDFYWIRFDIPPSNLGGLFSGSPYMTCNFPLTDGYRPGFDAPPLSTTGTALSWWNPNSVTSLVGGECSGTQSRTFMMMANTANPSLWTIYVEVRQG
jgi:hypothetical protein